MPDGLSSLLRRLLRSGAGGALAALTDLGVLTGLVSLAGVEPGLASAPALLSGMLVMFFAQKRFAFRSSGPLGAEALKFALVQAGGFLLTLGLYELSLRLIPGARQHYVLLRLVVTNLVWLAYSFPLWHLVFRARPAGEP